VIEYLEIPVIPAGNGKIGTYLAPNIIVNKNFYYQYGIIDSIKYGFLETSGQIHLTFVALKTLVQKIFFPETPVEREEAVESLAGPIGIVDFISESLSAGVIFLIILTAIISINL
jgi:membrane-associated protease RseP (regulator of RpoE activity)